MDETTDKVALIITGEAARIGLKIIDAVFEGVKIPEEARRFATSMGQQAMTMQYMKETTAEIPEGGGGAAAAGVGAGIGIAMGTALGKAMQAISRRRCSPAGGVVSEVWCSERCWNQILWQLWNKFGSCG